MDHISVLLTEVIHANYEGVIHSIDYHRLILDEAHSIKQRTTSVARACFALKATYKWCLSGTPVQNRIGEFFSLLRFLEVQPFACYFCKACDCRSLHWSQDRDKRCTSCTHRYGLFSITVPYIQKGLTSMTEDLIMSRFSIRRFLTQVSTTCM